MGLLTRLCLSRNDAVTDEGLIALAQAIDMCGLPELQEFSMAGLVEEKVTVLGLSAIAHAVIKGSPLLETIDIKCSGEGGASLHVMIEGMLRARGWTG